MGRDTVRRRFGGGRVLVWLPSEIYHSIRLFYERIAHLLLQTLPIYKCRRSGAMRWPRRRCPRKEW